MRIEPIQDGHRYRLVIVDDEHPFLMTLQSWLQGEGYSVSAAASIRDAMSIVEEMRAAATDPISADDVDDRTWFIAVLDHDFPTEHPPVTYPDPRDGKLHELRQGYDLARWMRVHHTLGRILPVIYLSGRESPQGFLEAMRENRQYHPDDFITKAEIAEDPERLLESISRFDEELSRLYSLMEEHGPMQGRYYFYDMFN